MVLEAPYTNIRDAAANIPLTKVSPGALLVGSPSGDRSGTLPTRSPAVAALALGSHPAQGKDAAIRATT